MTKPDEQKSTTRPPGESRDPATEPPPATSKPIGDAIPTPPEPGLDQPLPPKERPADEESTRP